MCIEQLFISPGHNYFGHHGQPPDIHPIVAVDEIECVAGRGIRGDRFFDYKPDYKGQITFFAAEVLDDLRISITDRCNERCLYCMPEGYKGWERQTDHLTAEEILRVVRVAAGMGFRKFRLTGGEPLVRRDVVEIVRAMHALPGVECVGLSTNGTKLAALAQPACAP